MKKLLLILFLIPLACDAQTNLNNNTVQINNWGDLTYEFPHCVGSADSISYTVTLPSASVYRKINSGLISWHENDSIVGVGDSVHILLAGDYKVHMWISVTTSNQNDILRIRTFINNIMPPISYGRFTIASRGAGIAQSMYFMGYFGLAANTWLSWHIENITGARDATISDLKIYVEKVPEK